MNTDRAIRLLRAMQNPAVGVVEVCCTGSCHGKVENVYPSQEDYSLDEAINGLEQLKEYRQLEEQGKLVKLPCMVGDTVWVVTSPFNVFDDIEYDDDMKDEVYESYVSSVSFYECGEQYRIYAKATNHFIGAYFRKCDFGKTVFLTQSEAEAKLRELRGENK